MEWQAWFYCPNTQVIPVEMNSHCTKNKNYAYTFCQIIPIFQIEPLTYKKKDQNEGKCNNIWLPP